MATYRNQFLFTSSQKCIYFWKSSGIEVFAGKEGEEGSRDGTVSYRRFYEATGITVEFDNVIYFCDRSVGLVKIITTLKEPVKFLDGLQCLVNAFSVHEKHHAYALRPLHETISLVSRCNEILSINTEKIRSVGDFPRSLDIPEGSVSAVSRFVNFTER